MGGGGRRAAARALCRGSLRASTSSQGRPALSISGVPQSNRPPIPPQPPPQVINIVKIRWDLVGEAVPAFLTMIVMPMTYSGEHARPAIHIARRASLGPAGTAPCPARLLLWQNCCCSPACLQSRMDSSRVFWATSSSTGRCLPSTTSRWGPAASPPLWMPGTAPAAPVATRSQTPVIPRRVFAAKCKPRLGRLAGAMLLTGPPTPHPPHPPTHLLPPPLPPTARPPSSRVPPRTTRPSPAPPPGRSCAPRWVGVRWRPCPLAVAQFSLRDEPPAKRPVMSPPTTRALGPTFPPTRRPSTWWRRRAARAATAARRCPPTARPRGSPPWRTRSQPSKPPPAPAAARPAGRVQAEPTTRPGAL